MKVGDIVRLKQPFYPPPEMTKAYRYGLVAGLVSDNGDVADAIVPTEILVNLYDPTTAEVYTDELGVKALYIFYPDEVDLA